jgi:hypothetical protein
MVYVLLLLSMFDSGVPVVWFLFEAASALLAVLCFALLCFADALVSLYGHILALLLSVRSTVHSLHA